MALNRYEYYWANDLSNDPTTGRPNREAPPPEVKSTGLKYNQPEPYEWYNYQHWKLGQGLFQLEDEYTASIQQEISDRENADIALQNNIDVGDNDLQSQINSLVSALSSLEDKVIPKVGDTWITKSTELPVERFGVGTWSLIEGRVLVGLDSTDPDFDTVGNFGGSKGHTHTDTFSVSSHTLTEAQIPSHTHTVNYVDAYYPENGPKVTSATQKETMPTGYNGNLGSSATDSDNDTFLTIDRTTESESTGAGSPHTHGLSGSVDTSSSLQPYEVVYIWERTA